MQDGKYVILCVDDDADMLEALQLVLESNGYHMVGARSAEEGLKTYCQVRPDLVIVDLMMEEVDAGTRLVRDLKAEGNTRPVYMLSSVGDNLNLMTDYSELGLSGVFQKPIDHHNLLAVLKAKLK
ncbi:MAG: response regulator [Phycisphaerales bacterium]|nr:response regulator [Phycisphaerales bacterium]